MLFSPCGRHARLWACRWPRRGALEDGAALYNPGIQRAAGDGGRRGRVRLWQELNGSERGGGSAAAAAVDTHEVRLWQELNGGGAKSAAAVM